MATFPIGAYVSVNTGMTYPLNEPRWCDDDGGLLDVDVTTAFEKELIASRPPNLWRYREALPICHDAEIVSFDEGMTPLLHMELSGFPICMKLDYLFPSGSYKDRGSTVLISYLKAMGVSKVVQDSSGNAAASLAQYCAKAGIECEIFVPESASPAKIHQIAAFGAAITRVSGTREDTADAAFKAAEKSFYASHIWHPVYFQGTKTFAYEVCEQLGWQAPDTIVLPVSNGALMLGVYVGLIDLLKAGIIGKLPKLIAVQTESCAPVFNAFHDGKVDVERVEPQATIAEGIAGNAPRRGKQLLRCVRETGGTCILVSEAEIKSALMEMCRQGFFVEPTAAVAVAGAKQYIRDHASESERIVSTLTGSGLKAAEQIARLVAL
jgi:threonine synthase